MSREQLEKMKKLNHKHQENKNELYFARFDPDKGLGSILKYRTGVEEPSPFSVILPKEQIARFVKDALQSWEDLLDDSEDS